MFSLALRRRIYSNGHKGLRFRGCPGHNRASERLLRFSPSLSGPRRPFERQRGFHALQVGVPCCLSQRLFSSPRVCAPTVRSPPPALFRLMTWAPTVAGRQEAGKAREAPPPRRKRDSSWGNSQPKRRQRQQNLADWSATGPAECKCLDATRLLLIPELECATVEPGVHRHFGKLGGSSLADIR